VSVLAFLIGMIAVLAAGSWLKTDTDKHESRMLASEWEFYRYRLLTPQDFAAGASEPARIPVPGSWRMLSRERDDLSRFGYGTYRIRRTGGIAAGPRSDARQHRP